MELERRFRGGASRYAEKLNEYARILNVFGGIDRIGKKVDDDELEVEGINPDLSPVDPAENDPRKPSAAGGAKLRHRIVKGVGKLNRTPL